MGASVTATGRQITTFMMESIGEIIGGSPIKIVKKSCVEKDGSISNTYMGDNDVIIYGDTDSVAADSMVRTNMGHMTIEELFLKGIEFTTLADGREFSKLPGLTSLTSDGNNVFEKPVLTVYRHKVKKAKWRITLASGKQVVVTNDHSIMVKRNGKLIEVKPSEIDCSTDFAVELPSNNQQTITFVECLGNFENEYVYDIVMEDGTMPYFFANDVLVHNSCYFLTGADNKEDAIRIADATGEEVNSRFPAFMARSFNCQGEHTKMIKGSREIVGSAGLFLPAKKKYTIKVINLDGYDLEVPKLKTMGSEMKKADTPKVIQEFLKELLNQILDSCDYATVEEFVNSQRGKLVRKIKDPISLGGAKQINNLDAKYAEWQRTEKVGRGKVQHMPGHVRAAINYNELAQKFAPGEATLLKAGDKGIVFYLAPNEYGYKAIAFPADITAFPKWFTDNFKIDRKLTESKMIDSKIEKTFETLEWEVPTPQKTFAKKLLKY